MWKMDFEHYTSTRMEALQSSMEEMMASPPKEQQLRWRSGWKGCILGLQQAILSDGLGLWLGGIS